MNQKNDPVPDFAIVFRGDEMQPIADVAPEGHVTIQLHNDTEEVHDFALIAVEEDELEWRNSSEPVSDEDIEVVGLIEGIPAHGAKAVTWPLEEGHYLMISNTPGAYLGASVFELTVQPADGRASGD